MNSRLPFWDIELVEFFLSISPENRIKRNLYLSAERNGQLVKELAAIQFEDEINISKVDLKKMMKNHLPNWLIIFLIEASNRKEVIAEGLTQIYSKKGNDVEEIIGPILNFPPEAQKELKTIGRRRSYQISYHLLSGLYALCRVYNKQHL